MEDKTERVNRSKAAAKSKQPETREKHVLYPRTTEAMAEYERKRLANIQRNIAFMTTMGVSSAKMAARTSIGRPKPVKDTMKRVIPSEQPARKSRRLRGQEAQFKLQTAKEAMTVEERKAEEKRKRALEKDNRRRFAADLYKTGLDGPSEQDQHLLNSLASKEQESDLVVDATGLDDVLNYELTPDNFIKTEHYMKSIAFYPRKDKVVVAFGDTKGNIGLWSADEKPVSQKSSVFMRKPHKRSTTQICFNPNDDSKLISSSSDGSVREFDLKAAVFTELYAGNSGVTSMALDNSHHTYLLSCENGNVVTLDQREPKTKYSSYQLHEKRINTVHHHPVITHCIATASLDQTVKLWDLRQMTMKNSTPIATMPHFRSVNCAYFSPNGAHLVTAGQDDFLHIYDTRTTKFLDPKKIAPKRSRIQIITECSMQTPRRLKIFDATRKNPVQELYSDLFNSVHLINVFHPRLPLIAGGSANGRLSLWREVQDDEREPHFPINTSTSVL